MSGRMLGRYAILAEIGKGPHGTVYRARSPDSQRDVAIKVLAPEAVNPKSAEPFRKHAPVLARLKHPLIASFIEGLDEQGRICLVYQLVEGTPLSSLLKEGAYPPAKKGWEIARSLLEALAYAHQHGLVHRNVKPANVFVTADDRVVLTDLGTSVLFTSRLAGAPEYASPEHFTGNITERSDIYQAGVIVYQLVTGKLPFTGDANTIAQRIAREKPKDPSSLNNKLAWQLDFVVQKALARNPAERFDAPLAFAEGLRLGMQDTVGKPLPPIEPARPLAAAAAKPAEAAPSAPARPVAPIAPPVQAAPAPASTAPKPAAANAPPAARPASALVQNAKMLAAKAAAETPAPDRGGRRGVLFVDDDPRILTSLKALFRQEYHVETAESGAAALEILSRGGIDVIVSDQRMPEMTGVELLRQVRVAAPRVIRLLLTGYTDLASLVGSINQGEIFKFAMKPWDNEELRKTLAEAMAAAAKAEAQTGKPVAPRSAGSLLVIDRGEGMAKGLERLLAGDAHVVRVESPAEAAKVLSNREIAAVVADMGSGMDGLVALFRELRAKRPGVLSILLTDEPDSELAIELINRAQIFRLLPKPVSARDLRAQVAEALRRYAMFKQRVAAAKAGEAAGAAPGRPLAGAA